MTLTDEQKLIIEETLTNEDGYYAIEACAGSGKSYTIFKAIDYIKEAQPFAKILYVIFNKANQEKADRVLSAKYPDKSVQARTMHSYALEKFRRHIRRINNDNTKNYSTLDTDIIFSIASKSNFNDVKYSKHAPMHWLHNKYQSSTLILETFCKSMLEHFEDYYEGEDKAKYHTIKNKRSKEVDVFGIPVNSYSCVTRAHIWEFEKIIKRHEKEKHYTFGMYLKGAAYSSKTGGDYFDYVFFDEAQDANIFMLKLLKKQDIKKFYFVGDTKQSINKFGGTSVNVFETETFDKKYTLSKSFRFGGDSVDLANFITHIHGDDYLHIQGTKQEHETDNNSHAVLYRTNASLFKDALRLSMRAKNQGIKLKIDDLRSDSSVEEYSELLAFLKLFYKYTDKQTYYKNQAFFESISTFGTLKIFEERLAASPLIGFYDVLNDMWDDLSDDIHSIIGYAKDMPDFIEYYNAFIEAKTCTNPDRVLTMITMHRSKGLEWDIVDIAEPTKLYFEDKNGAVRRAKDAEQELNLAYVAVTRARKRLNASSLRYELERESSCELHVPLVIDADKQLAQV